MTSFKIIFNSPYEFWFISNQFSAKYSYLTKFRINNFIVVTSVNFYAVKKFGLKNDGYSCKVN